MIVLVMSDSHGNADGMVSVVELEKPGLILHLGDKTRDCHALQRAFPDIPLRKVVGNCDFSSEGQTIDDFTFGGKHFFMTHGHVFHVKSTLAHLTEIAKMRKSDIVLFGHTHIQHHEIKNEFVILNPGSMSKSQEHYAVIHMTDGNITCDLKKL